MAHDVFVSYAREDQTTANAVVATLEQHEVRCWIAPRDVPPGRDYADVIVGAINEARVMVLVFSAHSNNSRHVMREVERAVNKGLTIVPFRIEDVTPSGSFEYFISGTHWLDALTTPLQQHLDRLVETVQRILGQEPTVTAAPARGGARPPGGGILGMSGRLGGLPVPVLAGGGAVAAIGVAVVLFMAMAGGSGNGTGTPTPTGGNAVQDTGTPEVSGTPEASDGASPTSAPPIALASGTVKAVAIGNRFACALDAAGSVKCWGENSSGQLGNGSTVASESPTFVCATDAGPPCSLADGNALSDVKAIAAGEGHACALTNGGGVKCWGANAVGELGDGTMNLQSTPVDVTGLVSGVKAIAAGGGSTWGGYSCAVMESGGVKCWGSNQNGQLGDATTTNKAEPTDVLGLSTAADTVATSGNHTCATVAQETIECWGSNGGGQLGDGSKTHSSVPVEVSSSSDLFSFVSVGSGGAQTGHTCALTSEGGVKCWGYNGRGQLGIGSTDAVYAPGTPVQGMASGVIDVAAGGVHSCAVTEAGMVKCWGRNQRSQLGGATEESQSASPVIVSDLEGTVVEQIDAWGDATCVVTDQGGVLCWGDGQEVPIPVVGLD